MNSFYFIRTKKSDENKRKKRKEVFNAQEIAFREEKKKRNILMSCNIQLAHNIAEIEKNKCGNGLMNIFKCK